MIVVIIKGLVRKTIAIKYKHGSQNTFQSRAEILCPSWMLKHTCITMRYSTMLYLKNRGKKLVILKNLYHASRPTGKSKTRDLFLFYLTLLLLL